jgi:hypothetical protein
VPVSGNSRAQHEASRYKDRGLGLACLRDGVFGGNGDKWEMIKPHGAPD